MTKGMIFIKDRFEESGMSQGEFAEKIGVNKSTVCRWLKGIIIPNLEHFEKMLDILGYDPVYVSKEECEELIEYSKNEVESPKKKSLVEKAYRDAALAFRRIFG